MTDRLQKHLLEKDIGIKMIAFVKWIACLFHFIYIEYLYNGPNIIYIEEGAPQIQLWCVHLLVRKEVCLLSS